MMFEAGSDECVGAWPCVRVHAPVCANGTTYANACLANRSGFAGPCHRFVVDGECPVAPSDARADGRFAERCALSSSLGMFALVILCCGFGCTRRRAGAARRAGEVRDAPTIMLRAA